MKKKRKKKVYKKTIFIVLFIFLIGIFIVGGFVLFNNKDKDYKFNLVGSWYFKKDDKLFKYEFLKDGKFTLINDSNDIEAVGTYEFYDYDMNLFLFYDEEYKDSKTPTYYEYSIFSYDSNNFITYSEQFKYYTKFYNKDSKVKEYSEDCIKEDLKGFCINDGYLSTYTGKANKITIPSDVHTIGSNAFAADFDRGVRLETVIIPGTVKIIERSAFFFSNVSNVFIEEGVERIGEHAFSEACPNEIHFPKSMKDVDYPMFGAEEYCRGHIDIYVYKDSYMDKYFKEHKPLDYSDYTVHYE